MSFAHRISFEFNPVGIVDETIEHRIGQRRVGDTGVPIGHGDLGGYQGSAAALTVVDDFEQVPGLGTRGSRSQSSKISKWVRARERSSWG
jgi:hypothetical protein